jgi:signal transduction histidine kinase
VTRHGRPSYDELNVTGSRLTRQEIGWLLAQEARSAARALRDGVTQLRHTDQVRSTAEPPHYDVTLDALDGAIELLTELESAPPQHGRRGRIDLASLAYELAPGARIVMEPGAGTEVSGDESELRRMVHVLVRQSPGAPDDANPQEVHIRRQEDYVKITVPLGPDRSATTELERRWLARMASQLGGRLELEGSAESLILPAEGAAEQREVWQLRQELAEAEQLGAAYARELAQIISREVEAERPPSRRDDQAARARFDLLVCAATALERELKPVVEWLRAEQDPSNRLGSFSELFCELGRVADCPRSEPAELVDLSAMLAEVGGLADAYAERHAVKLAVAAGPQVAVRTGRAALGLLLRSLVHQAVLSTPRDGEVRLCAMPAARGATVIIADGGPTVPESAAADLLCHRVDPTAFGRPPGIALLVADTLAAHLGGSLRLRRGPQGGSEIELALPSLGGGADLG